MINKNLVCLSLAFVMAVFVQNASCVEMLRPEDEGVLWSFDVNEGDETRGILTQVVEGTLVQREVSVNELPVARPQEPELMPVYPDHGRRKVRIINRPAKVRVRRAGNSHIRVKEPDFSALDDDAPYYKSRSARMEDLDGKYPRAIKVRRANGDVKVMHWKGDESVVSDSIEIPTYQEVSGKKPVYVAPAYDAPVMDANDDDVPMIDEGEYLR